MAKKKDMLSIALGDEEDEDLGLEYGAGEDLEDELMDEDDADEESVDSEAAVIADLVDAGFSEDKASALVDAILALKA